MNRRTFENLPYLKPDLATFYTAAFSGNHEAANAARKLAYTEDDGLGLADEIVQPSETQASNKRYVNADIGLNVRESPGTDKQIIGKLSKGDEVEFTGNKTGKIGNHEWAEIRVGDKTGWVAAEYLNTARTQKTNASITSENSKNNHTDAENPEQVTTMYYGNYWGSKSPTDMTFGNQTKEDIVKMPWITQTEFLTNEHLHLFSFKALANITSSGKMRNVLNDMIDHFADGTGTPYSNQVLTEKVKNHKSTQNYMKDFSKVFCSFVEKYSGDVSSFADSEEFKEALRKNNVFFTKYDYGFEELFSGLMFAIHGWTESKVDITEFIVEKDGTYSGNLKFTFMDNFGLDADDINEFGFLSGFRSWYVLQHYNGYEGKYKPFKTIVTIDLPISGKFSESKK